jgi:hypothetical protein
MRLYLNTLSLIAICLYEQRQEECLQVLMDRALQIKEKFGEENEKY